MIHYAGEGIFDKDLKIKNKLQQVKFDSKLIRNIALKKKYETYLNKKYGIKYKFPLIGLLIIFYKWIFGEFYSCGNRLYELIIILYEFREYFKNKIKIH
jgi:hypothetical protein